MYACVRLAMMITTITMMLIMLSWSMSMVLTDSGRVSRSGSSWYVLQSFELIFTSLYRQAGLKMLGSLTYMRRYMLDVIQRVCSLVVVLASLLFRLFSCMPFVRQTSAVPEAENWSGWVEVRGTRTFAVLSKNTLQIGTKIAIPISSLSQVVEWLEDGRDLEASFGNKLSIDIMYKSAFALICCRKRLGDSIVRLSLETSDDALAFLESFAHLLPNMPIIRDTRCSPAWTLASLPDKNSQLPEYGQCCVCQDEMSELASITTLRCGHAFHCRCIHSWAYSGAPSSRRCPKCRAMF